MFIRMIIEENPNNSEEDVTTECTELIQVKKAIESLNGTNKTAIFLKKDESNYMVIGGGLDNKYIVRAISQNKAYNMSNKFDGHKDPSEINVGGKIKSYPSRKVMNLDMVLESAKHFADRGSLAQTFNWETQ